MSTLEFGLDTFLPGAVDPSGLPIAGDQVIRNAAPTSPRSTRSRRVVRT
jgi:hypothetical protein